MVEQWGVDQCGGEGTWKFRVDLGSIGSGRRDQVVDKGPGSTG